MVMASISGTWLPNSSLALVKVELAGNDPRGLYRLLGISPTSTEQEVRRAAKRRMLESHPDTGGDQEEFSLVLEAYETLNDRAKRAAYDKERPQSKVTVKREPKGVWEPPVTEAGEPAFFKEPQSILSEADIALVREWQSMLLEAAHGFGTALDIKAGIGKCPSGYAIEDGIAVIDREAVPQRWAAMLFILREMSLKCLT